MHPLCILNLENNWKKYERKKNLRTIKKTQLVVPKLTNAIYNLTFTKFRNTICQSLWKTFSAISVGHAHCTKMRKLNKIIFYKVYILNDLIFLIFSSPSLLKKYQQLDSGSIPGQHLLLLNAESCSFSFVQFSAAAVKLCGIYTQLARSYKCVSWCLSVLPVCGSNFATAGCLLLEFPARPVSAIAVHIYSGSLSPITYVVWSNRA